MGDEKKVRAASRPDAVTIKEFNTAKDRLAARAQDTRRRAAPAHADAKTLHREPNAPILSHDVDGGVTKIDVTLHRPRKK